MPPLATPDPPGYLEFDAATLPREAQFAAWGSALAAYATSTRFPERGFEARVRAWMVPPVVVTDSRLGPVRYQRTREAALHDGLDDITFQLLLAGRSRGLADGHAFRAGPGDVAVQDAALSLDATATATRSITVTMPRAFLDEAAPGLDVHGAVLRDGMGALLAGLLRTLPAALDGMEDGVADEASAAIPRIVRDVLAAALLARPAPGERKANHRPLRDRVRRFVAANIAAPLTAGAIGVGVGASRASLYRAFGDRGGVMAYVLEQRLLRARRMLADAARPTSVAAAAAANGFRDASDLGRAFRRRFGITPGAARRDAAARARPAGPVQERFRSWTDDPA